MTPNYVLFEAYQRGTELISLKNVNTTVFITGFRPPTDQKCTMEIANHYNMTVWILAGNDINFTIAAGLVRLHMPGGK